MKIKGLRGVAINGRARDVGELAGLIEDSREDNEQGSRAFGVSGSIPQSSKFDVLVLAQTYKSRSGPKALRR